VSLVFHDWHRSMGVHGMKHERPGRIQHGVRAIQGVLVLSLAYFGYHAIDEVKRLCWRHRLDPSMSLSKLIGSSLLETWNDMATRSASQQVDREVAITESPSYWEAFCVYLRGGEEALSPPLLTNVAYPISKNGDVSMAQPSARATSTSLVYAERKSLDEIVQLFDKKERESVPVPDGPVVTANLSKVPYCMFSLFEPLIRGLSREPFWKKIILCKVGSGEFSCGLTRCTMRRPKTFLCQRCLVSLGPNKARNAK
jgi:hypothetical protein